MRYGEIIIFANTVEEMGVGIQGDARSYHIQVQVLSVSLPLMNGILTEFTYSTCPTR